MKFKNIVPIFIITAALSGCDSVNPFGDNDKAIYFPESTEKPKVQGLVYKPCYTRNGAIAMRGAPISAKEKLYKCEGRVMVFPMPRIPRDGIGDVSPRDLYSNLANTNPQVRSDTLYVIDTVLEDSPDTDNTSAPEKSAQIQGMLDDYIKNMEKRKDTDPTEYEIAKDIYDRHFADRDEELNRPNWKGIPGNTFSGHGIADKPVKTTIADKAKDTATISAPAKEPVKTVDIEDAKELDKTPYKEVKATDINEEKPEIKKPLATENIPDFDFTDPKKTAFVEKTELEVQMEKNKELSSQKKTEDAIIDKDISSVLVDDELADWNCTQNMCATRLQDSGLDIADLIATSKGVLNDKTSHITPRLYAICSLKCASQADKKYEGDVIEFLSNYLRRRAPWIIPAKGEKEPAIKAVRPDVQAALYVVGARDRMRNVGFDINLIGTDLRGADMSFANLYNTNLSFSNLASTNLQDAYGLLDWNKVYLTTIDEMTKIPESIFAGFVVVKKPSLPIQPAGSYTVTSDDWIYWTAVPVK